MFSRLETIRLFEMSRHWNAAFTQVFCIFSVNFNALPAVLWRISEIIRNKTLDFFSSTLPILKADKNLPKLAKYEDFDVVDRSDQQYLRPVVNC